MSEMYLYANHMYHLLITSSTASTFAWYPGMFLKSKKKTNLDWQRKCWFQVPLQLVIVLPISVKDIFLASSSSTHLLIQTDFLWFLACVYLRVRRATDGYDKFLFVHIRGHAVWQIALLFFSSGFSEFSFCFIFPHDRASYDL